MGTLYIVATPIGNLADITYRAVEILGSVDYIACEDSRRTGILLQQVKSQKLKVKSYSLKSINDSKEHKLITIHEHSKDEKIEWLISELINGKSVALVTDAGTPGIADPGGRVVEKAIEAGITVVPIPGPSSLSAILSITGWQNELVLFLGYLPKKKGRQTLLKTISKPRRDLLGSGGRLSRGGGGAVFNTIVFFESPFRINKTIKELVNYLGDDCQAVIGRELTKQFEEIVRGTLGELAKSELKEKGEFVVAIKL